jgi:CTD small phosphatase-like protein 2
MKIISDPDPEEIEQRMVDLPTSKHQKTVIFDLDETLIHCIDDIENNPYDLPITVNFPTGETVQAGINIRPFAYECLKKVREHY